METCRHDMALEWPLVEEAVPDRPEDGHATAGPFDPTRAILGE
jgi:hypothetical protein